MTIVIYAFGGRRTLRLWKRAPAMSTIVIRQRIAAARQRKEALARDMASLFTSL